MKPAGSVGRLPQVHDLYPGRAFVVCLALIQSAAGAVPPTVGGVITASTFGGSTSAAPGSFIEIYGADLSNTTRQWSTADFDGPRAPTSLDGVTVTVGGQSAFVYYVSPGQVDALLPSGISADRKRLPARSRALCRARHIPARPLSCSVPDSAR